MERLPQGRPAQDNSPAGGAGIPECELLLSELRPDQAANDTRMSQLARTIELEIIPRLMMAHRAVLQDPGIATTDATLRPDDVKRFTALVLSPDEDAAYTAVQALRTRQIAVESLYLDLLAPTARYLGELWEQDLCSFTDVTVGLGRLQRVLRELSPALGRSVAHADQGRRVLLLPSPGEQHTFGLVMVAEFFRRAGWNITGGAWADGLDAASLVSAEWFDVVGFSLAAEVHVPALRASIAAVRQAACNRRLKVLVGGPLFALDPALADAVGADGMTIDGKEAPLLAERLIEEHPQNRASRG